ncbi:MAG: GAF domain-containing protein [Leptolyngbyaceae cyanobacterium SL_5_9]|nr:GAF domain-containing protein [Leptolyngbyaceae cyanobacterium SL_5_9]NJO73577.1 GAF domain-containing protein [Leptolyngbyaceae cyanobacterium RM1_406_9]
MNKQTINSSPIDSLEILLHRMMNRIRQSLELPTILNGTVAEVRAFLGTDRVKVYQFHPDGSGKVVAESVQSQRLPSLLGQNFPAEDIPPEARELFLRARQRSIVDVSLQQIGVSPLDCLETGEVLDVDDIRFRSVDPCHIEYLTAMGVQSSLVVPILHRDQLWGLLVSHHADPRQVTERELQVVQLVADQVSIAIAQSTLLSQTRAQAQQEATINRVATLLHSMTEIKLQQALEQIVSALKGIGGRVYVSAHDSGQAKLFTWGVQPVLSKKGRKKQSSPQKRTQDSKLKTQNSSTHVAAVVEQYPSWQSCFSEEMQPGENGVWAIADLHQSTLSPDLTQVFLDSQIRGLLVVPLQYRQQQLGYLSVFRQAIEVETLWAGRYDQDDPRHLRPRKSFETWRELKQEQADEWSTSEIELAQALGSHLAMAIHQYELYRQVRALNADLERDIQERKQAEIKICALNAELEQRVLERTVELQRSNEELVRQISERDRAWQERKQARASLERLSHQNELILNSAGEGIYGLDAQGKTTFVNPAAARMLGYEVEELTGKFMHEILAPFQLSEAPNPDNPIYATLREGTVNHVAEDLFRRRDQSSFPVEYVSTPIREADEIVGAVVIFKDITERQIVEQMKDEFISVVSHELRTPLTSIRTTLGLLASGWLNAQPEKSQRMLEIAFSNTNRLVRLINDILDIERIKFGKVTMEKQACNAADLMTQATDVVRAMADKAEVYLAVITTEAQLWVDPDRIIQALTNLLSNAIKFSPTAATVSLTAELQAQQIIFEVKDQGRGIPEDKLETIFDRFQQIDTSNSRSQGGTGLGLAICRSIVQQHGGKIWAESKLGKGSSFYVSLPLSHQSESNQNEA